MSALPAVTAKATRTFLSGLGLLALTVFVGWPLVFRAWLAIAINWGEYHLWEPWFDQMQLLLWGVVAGLFVVFSLLFVILGAPAQPIKTSVALGILGGASMFLLGRRYFIIPHLVDYIWAWGTYLMAPLGALVGASFAPSIQRSFRLTQ